MYHSYSIYKALYHLLSIIFFIIMLVINITEYMRAEYYNPTYKVMLAILLIFSIIITVITGISLSKHKIKYD